MTLAFKGGKDWNKLKRMKGFSGGEKDGVSLEKQE